MPAVFDPATGMFKVTLKAGTTPGTASVSATANSQAIAAQNVPFLVRAQGTGGGPSPGGGGKKEDDGGGCTAPGGAGVWFLGILAICSLCLRRRKLEAGARNYPLL